MTAPDGLTEKTDGGPGLHGEVVYLYAFDVANEIRFDQVGTLLSDRPTLFAVQPNRSAPRSVSMSRPLAVEPAVPAVSLNGLPIRLLVRVYAVGVVSVTVRVAFARDALDGLLPFHHPRLEDGRPLDAMAQDLCAEVVRDLGPSLVRPGPVGDPEAYAVFLLTALGGEQDASRWLAGHRQAAAGLLAETPPDRLSEQQVEDALRLYRTYETGDLVVIDWGAALVVDLNGTAEAVLFVLELANLQLEEFRWMDRVLDRYLDRAHQDLASPRWWAFGAVAAVLHSLRRLRIDLARLADEVANITKFVGDWHLARVYALTRERFHLDQWRASVGERLSHLDQLYALTRGELHDRRMLWLEVLIVLFFAADLLLILLVRK
jgi:hypothetical protein